MVTQLRIMGLDAAFANTGIALATYDPSVGLLDVNELRLIKTEADKVNKKVVRKNSDDLRRAREIIRGVDQAIADFNPHFVMVEVPTGTQSARSAWALGIAVGAIASIRDTPVIEVTPKEVKAVVNKPFPDKSDMIEWAVGKYPTANWPMRGGKVVAGQAEHMADACAAIHAGCYTEEFKRAMAMFRVMR